MRVRIQDLEIPYPLTTISGRLRLCGLSELATAQILSGLGDTHPAAEEKLLTYVSDALGSISSEISKNFRLLNIYEELRGTSDKIPPLILALEGASATGKSMLAIDFVHYLSSTRFISTDTVRQVLRGIYSKDEYPELYCHTYQAHTRRQSGNPKLDPVLRGYIAQCEVISPSVFEMVKRIHSEGASAIIEGVHLEPGSIGHISKGILEILINPSEDTHRSMFITKHAAGKLRTVSKDSTTREEEFLSTRKIQEYLVAKAKEAEIAIVDLHNYDTARKEISNLIITKIETIILEHT
jgi:2-phosphoglycerate kinase